MNENLYTVLASCDREMIERNLSKFSDLNFYFKGGETPLLAAISMSHISTIKKIIAKGADINLANKITGETPIQIAYRRDFTLNPMVIYLSELGADVNKLDNTNVNMLTCAINLSDYEVVQYLIANHQLNLNIGINKRLLFLFTIDRKDYQMIDLLISQCSLKQINDFSRQFERHREDFSQEQAEYVQKRLDSALLRNSLNKGLAPKEKTAKIKI